MRAPSSRGKAGGSSGRISEQAPGWVVLPLLALAAVLRGLGIGERGLWLDEAMSHRFASAPLSELPALLRLDSGPPLYYLLLKGWMALFGDGEAALRALSAGFGFALVGALFWVGREFWSPRVGLFAAALAASSPIALRYAQEARAYTLLALLGLMAFYGLERWISNGDRRWLAGHALAFAAALYTHNYAVFLWLAAALVAAHTGWRRRSISPALGLLGAVGLFAFWWPVLRAQLANPAPTAWMAAFWSEHRWLGSSVLGSWRASLASLSPGGPQPPYVGLSTPDWGAWLVLPFSLAVAGGLAVVLRRARRAKIDEARRPRAGLLALWLVAYTGVPLVAAAAVSAVRSPIYLPGRLDQVVLPAVLLAVAVALDAIPRRALRGLAVAGYVLISILTWHHALRRSDPPAERELAAQVSARVEGGEIWVVQGLARAPLEYAARGLGSRVEWRSFPAETGRHPGYDCCAGTAPAAFGEEAERLWSELEGRGAARTFLVITPDPRAGLLLDALRRRQGLAGASKLGSFTARITGQPLDVFEVRWKGRP